MNNKRIEVLDHGYVGLVEHWGSDQRIIEAARMSTNKGFKGWGPYCKKCGDPVEPNDNGSWCDRCSRLTTDVRPGDEKLLRYLYVNKHSTPFEMAGLVVEVKAPIFVYRQWHRHRTQSYNEMSARYTPLPDENYVPSVERLMVNSTKNKQAGTKKSAEEMTEAVARSYQHDLKIMYDEQEVLYQQALCHGVPKELARIHLPVARYSKMRASANLRNWLGFLTLRMDEHAQWEVRQYALAVGSMIAELFPRTWELFIDGRG